MKKYRIIKDSFAGYECQVKYPYWPFWIQMDITNTHSSLESAKQYIKNNRVVWESHPNKK